MAIDRSEDGAKVFVLVSAREHVLKRKGFLNNVSWLKHFREIHPRRKHAYLAKLPNRFSKISGYLVYVRIFMNVEELLNFIEKVKPAVVLVDDKLLKIFQKLNILVIPERSIQYKHHKALMLLADNLANYFRILLRDKPRNFRRELRRFEK